MRLVYCTHFVSRYRTGDRRNSWGHFGRVSCRPSPDWVFPKAGAGWLRSFLKDTVLCIVTLYWINYKFFEWKKGCWIRKIWSHGLLLRPSTEGRVKILAFSWSATEYRTKNICKTEPWTETGKLENKIFNWSWWNSSEIALALTILFKDNRKTSEICSFSDKYLITSSRGQQTDLLMVCLGRIPTDDFLRSRTYSEETVTCTLRDNNLPSSPGELTWDGTLVLCETNTYLLLLVKWYETLDKYY